MQNSVSRTFGHGWRHFWWPQMGHYWYLMGRGWQCIRESPPYKGRFSPSINRAEVQTLCTRTGKAPLGHSKVTVLLYISYDIAGFWAKRVNVSKIGREERVTWGFYAEWTNGKGVQKPRQKLVIRTWMMVVEKWKECSNPRLIRKEVENEANEVVDRVEVSGFWMSSMILNLHLSGKMKCLTIYYIMFANMQPCQNSENRRSKIKDLHIPLSLDRLEVSELPKWNIKIAVFWTQV